ncbi:hypothetical protein HZA57_07510 [Candidatus Poribacteria bacterium]|nr:hypothetical protein [Candidatus Poribacteria bacterium]
MKQSSATLKQVLIAFLVAVCPVAADAQGQSVIDTKHNLSVSGPGAVRATSEERVCIFCHTPHGGRGDAPLWNRTDPAGPYIPYNSPTLKSSPGQPTGASKLCLSCHDGTIALGDLLSEAAPVAMTSIVMPAGDGLIGTDLRDDHPVSFDYMDALAQSGGELTAPASWDPKVKLDPVGLMQCTSCHDPHDDQWGKFLVLNNIQSSLCRQCHAPEGFDPSPHAQSNATWNGSGTDPWPHTAFTTVADNACMNCHQAHHADGAIELVTHAQEETVCLVCHDGNTARSDMRPVFQKAYRHSVEFNTGVHQPGESPAGSSDHVECADCHNPHRAADGPAAAPAVMGELAGVSGIDAVGVELDEAQFEYEVCFKCHADGGVAPLHSITRQINSLNTRNEFATASPSFHPVEVPGMNPSVPSLLAPWTEGSMVYCSDCHGNDSPTASADGTAGPHGSTFEFLLARQYETGDPVAEGPGAYALCYGCHSRDSILANESFSSHAKHIVDAQTSCSVCHDGHGIDQNQGNALNNAHLINFDTSVVEQEPSLMLIEYQSFGGGAGQCTLRCHGVDHSPKTYP